jgi:predicted transcriptional regulator
MKAMASAPFSLRLDPDVRSRLEEEAKSLDRSASYVATKAIESFLDARSERRRMLEEALAEADKGVFISGEAMDAWVESWGTVNELPPPEPDIFPDGGKR